LWYGLFLQDSFFTEKLGEELQENMPNSDRKKEYFLFAIYSVPAFKNTILNICQVKEGQPTKLV